MCRACATCGREQARGDSGRAWDCSCTAREPAHGARAHGQAPPCPHPSSERPPCPRPRPRLRPPHAARSHQCPRLLVRPLPLEREHLARALGRRAPKVVEEAHAKAGREALAQLAARLKEHARELLLAVQPVDLGKGGGGRGRGIHGPAGSGQGTGGAAGTARGVWACKVVGKQAARTHPNADGTPNAPGRSKGMTRRRCPGRRPSCCGC